MARFELTIYGENDEIEKVYETDHVRYGVLMKALEYGDKVGKKGQKEQMEAANAIVKRVFAGLTDEELLNADMEDVLAVFTQVTRQAGKIEGSEASKN